MEDGLISISAKQTKTKQMTLTLTHKF